MKFSFKDFFSEYDQIRRKLWICSHELKKSLMENFIFLCNVSKLNAKNYSFQPCASPNFRKIPGILSAVYFLILQKQALADSLRNSCSKQLYGKIPGRSASVLKMDSKMDVLLGSFRKFSEQLTKFKQLL